MDLETVDDCEQDNSTLIKWKEQHLSTIGIKKISIGASISITHWLKLLYVHRTQCVQQQFINRRIRPLHFWNCGRLKIRQTDEIAIGKFGMVKSLDNIEMIEDDEEEYVDLDKEENEKNEEEFSDSDNNEDIGVEVIQIIHKS
uniref:Uncharacterized protein n=1 Tax=Lactuca sativa TaxID=4236 RepID=A0A9R1WHJ0_LACSA|nr:hypothetical protein LSAT_V11C200096100 [Lactuca sativa]